MALLVVLALMMIAPGVEKVQAQSACTHFASPTGLSSNNGLTSAAPFRIQDFWAVATPGKVLCLMDGTYTGTPHLINSQIQGQPAGTPSGTLANPIVIRALNDGQVLLDGQGSNQPINFNRQSFITVQGVNARNGHFGVVNFYGSRNITVQRVCAWDTLNDTNDHVWVIYGAQNTLVEDTCGFGNGRDTFLELGDSGSGVATGNVVRRFWGRWDGYCNGGKTDADSMQYNYGNTDTNLLVDNWIGIFNGWLMSQPGCNTTFNDNPKDQFAQRTNGTTGTGTPGNRFNGLILFASSGSPQVMHTAFLRGADTDDTLNASKGVNLTDAYIDMTNQPGARTVWIFPPNCVGTNSITRVTSVAGVGIGGTSCFSVSNLNHFSTFAAASGLFAGPTDPTRPNLCFRYQNGALTNTPLWPWPMDDRIKAALAIRGAPALTGVDGTGSQTHKGNTVTSDIINKYGAIPAACYGSGAGGGGGGGGGSNLSITSIPGPFPTTPILSTFSQANGAPANMTAISGSGLTVVGNQLVAPDTTAFHMSKWNTSFGADQEAYARIPTLPAENTSQMVIAWRVQANNDRYAMGLSRVVGAANDTIQVTRWVGANATDICTPPIPLESGGAPADATANDQIGVRMRGSTIEIFYAPSGGTFSRLAVCDDTGIQSGGFIAFGHAGAGAFDDIGGGNVSSTLPAVVQRPAISGCPGLGCPAAVARPLVPQ